MTIAQDDIADDENRKPGDRAADTGAGATGEDEGGVASEGSDDGLKDDQKPTRK